jgi:hypothetical protein
MGPECQDSSISTLHYVLLPLFLLSIPSIPHLVLSYLWRAPLFQFSLLYSFYLASQADHVDRASYYHTHASTVSIHSFLPSVPFVRRFAFLPDLLNYLFISKMHFSKLACVAALSAVVRASPAPASANGNAASGGGTGTTLLANAIQSGSFNDGSNEIGSAEVGQALSTTSQNNFINNCAGKTLTNGLQITTGSCNGISRYPLL